MPASLPDHVTEWLTEAQAQSPRESLDLGSGLANAVTVEA